MLHAYSLVRNTKTLYYKVDSLTQERVGSITIGLNVMGIDDIATNLHLHQLRITVPNAMSSNIIDLVLSACGCSNVEAYVPPEVASWESKSIPKPR